jgi:hypothetical protein
MTEEDYKYRQGRSREVVEKNQKIATIAAVGLGVLIVTLSIYNYIKHGN